MFAGIHNDLTYKYLGKIIMMNNQIANSDDTNKLNMKLQLNLFCN